MGAETKIEWCDATWNPVRGCSRISPGCGGANHQGGCYAEKIAARFSGPGQPFEGFAERTKHGGRWTGKLALIPEQLELPMRWRKPRRIFVNSMSDLFHEEVPDEAIDKVFAVMALCPQHTFQVLTKRADRMQEYMCDPQASARIANLSAVIDAGRLGELDAVERISPINDRPGYFVTSKGRVLSDRTKHRLVLDHFDRPAQPGEQGRHLDGDPTNNALWNLCWGTQVSNWTDSKRHGTHRRYSKLTIEQATELKRRLELGEPVSVLAAEFKISGTQVRNIGAGKQWAVPDAAMPWPLPQCWLGVSAENQAMADLRIPTLLSIPARVRFLSCEPLLGPVDLTAIQQTVAPGFFGDALQWYHRGKCHADEGLAYPAISWVIAGSESGPNSRASDLEWFRALRDQCREAGVPFFQKQLTERGRKLPIEQWPADLRVREFPT